MNEMQQILPVVLAGGGGTRLWPLSRGHYPKQFLVVEDGVTLLQGTLKRLTTQGKLPANFLQPMVVSARSATRLMMSALIIRTP